MARRTFRAAALPETFVADAAALAECVEHLRTVDLLGFDTEFVGEETFRPELCLVQISTVERLTLPLADADGRVGHLFGIVAFGEAASHAVARS